MLFWHGLIWSVIGVLIINAVCDDVTVTCFCQVFPRQLVMQQSGRRITNQLPVSPHALVNCRTCVSVLVMGHGISSLL